MVTQAPEKRPANQGLTAFVAIGIALSWATLLSLALRAWLVLGHWPRLYVDDPKQLGFGWHYDVAGLAIVAGAALTLFGGCTALTSLLFDRRRVWTASIPVYVSVVASICLAAFTPLVSWYLD